MKEEIIQIMTTAQKKNNLDSATPQASFKAVTHVTDETMTP
jgi:hypothetical protein